MTDKKGDYSIAAAYRADKDIGNDPKGRNILSTPDLGAKLLDQYEGNIRDVLTGAFNRLYLNEEIETLIAKNDNFALVLIDIDHFKSINDTHGHLTGDVVLKRLVLELSNEVKIARPEGSEDILARWGGEEIAIILRNVHELETAKKVAERGRGKIQGLNFVSAKGEKFKVTISGGVVVFNKNENLEEMTKRVDQALYLAKEGGRNRIISK